MYSAIVCVDRDWRMAVREENILPRIPHHLNKIKRLAKGHKCILGHTTYDMGFYNDLDLDIVVYSMCPDVELEVPVIHDLAFRCVMGNDWYDEWKEEVFVLGGLSMFKQHLLAIRRLYVTFIDGAYEPKKNEKQLFFPFEEWMASLNYDAKISCDWANYLDTDANDISINPYLYDEKAGRRIPVNELIQDRVYESKSLAKYRDITDARGTSDKRQQTIAGSEKSGTGSDAVGDRLQTGELEFPTVKVAGDYILKKLKWDNIQDDEKDNIGDSSITQSDVAPQ